MPCDNGLGQFVLSTLILSIMGIVRTATTALLFYSPVPTHPRGLELSRIRSVDGVD